MAVGSGQPPVRVHDTVCQYTAQWSPDGRWIACPEHGHISLISPDGKTLRMVGGRPGMVTWSRDSKTLYTLGQDEKQKWLFTTIDVPGGSEKTLAVMGAEENFWTNFRDASMISLAPDGKSIAATSNPFRSDVWVLEGFPQPRAWIRRLLWWR